MKTSILLPLGGLFLMLCNTGYGQQYTARASMQTTSVSTHHTSHHIASQQFLAGADLIDIEWLTDTHRPSGVQAGRPNALGFTHAPLAPPAGNSGYSTAIGLRGGYTSGITFKHFVRNNAALELVLGTRWEGFSLTALYEWHSPNALGVSQLSWVYGLGGRIGSYRGDRYYRGRGNCNNPNDRNCGSYWGNRNLTAVGIVGIGGLEFKFDEVPFTVSLDLIPVLYLNHWGGTFFDGSLSVRYVIN